MARVRRTTEHRWFWPVYWQGRAATEGAAGRPRKSFRASLLAIAQILASAVPTTATSRINSRGRTSWNGTSTVAIAVVVTR